MHCTRLHRHGGDTSCRTVAGYCFYSAGIPASSRHRIINLLRSWYAQRSGLYIVLMNSGLVCLPEHLKNILTERLLCLLIKSGIATHIKVFLMLTAHQRYLSSCKTLWNYMTACNLQAINMLVFLYSRHARYSAYTLCRVDDLSNAPATLLSDGHLKQM